MSVNNIVDEINDLRNAYEEARRELCEKLKPSFHELFAPYLNKYPFIKALKFTAYTPYFMDGDECVYSVNELEVEFTDSSSDEEPDEPIGFGGPDPEDIIAYRVDGTITESLRSFTSYYTEPRKERTNFYNRVYGETEYHTVPAQYASVGDFLEAHYPHLLKMSYTNLKNYLNAEKELVECENILRSLPEDIIKDLFGDHVQVYITKDSVVGEEYEHH